MRRRPPYWWWPPCSRVRARVWASWAASTLISLHVPDTRRAEANAVMNMGGYLPAGLLAVSAGYAIDFLGLSTGTAMFAAVLALSALVFGGAVLRAESPRGATRDVMRLDRQAP